ncbi:MAG: hypothetical protein A3F18_00430 [Legionellales bacterium RIFCSPHIGHO2_12_FULL_37_14]|nr:MAG: hypothetical protein A3F18_00430 [Legionellales bacterium RIFCSPHIGHO2_12_FULL_37_14]
MQNSDFFSRTMETLYPYLVYAIAIGVLFCVFIVLSYILFWGLVIGAALWAITIIKLYLTKPKKTSYTRGRVIEHDAN